MEELLTLDDLSTEHVGDPEGTELLPSACVHVKHWMSFPDPENASAYLAAESSSYLVKFQQRKEAKLWTAYI